MAILNFNVSYNDFQLDQIINPDEFDVNFADISIRLNQIIDVLNQITDGIGGSGASIIHLNEIAPFVSPNLQAFLEELVARLESQETISGASLIGVFPVDGITGSNVQEKLESVAAILAQLRLDLDTNVIRLDELIAKNAGDIATLDSRITVNDEQILNLDAVKIDREDVYDKAQSEKNLTDLESSIYLNVYDKDETEALLEARTPVDGDHEGTWQGLTVADLADKLGVSGVSINLNRPSNPVEKTLWFNPATNQYALFLNGQWRISGAPTQIKRVHNRVVTQADTNRVAIGIENFNSLYDGFIVMQNSVFAAEGYEYNISADGLEIVNPNGNWDMGTTFDFVAFISVPLVE